MGVRLVRYNRANSGTGGALDFSDHDELINRDMMNQHPIYAIIGLQEVLNILEDAIQEANQTILLKETEINANINNVVVNINQDIEAINNLLESTSNTINNLNIIDTVIDSNTIDLTYDATAKSLKADVKLRSDIEYFNLIRTFNTGLYVPKTNPIDTPSIIWNRESNGKTMQDFFNTCKKFCHVTTSGSVDMATTGYINSWSYSSNAFNIVTSTSNYLTGILSFDFYDFYTHTIRLWSTAKNYQRANGVMIGHVLDELGKPHTLSVIISRGIPSFLYAIVYNYNLPGETIVKQGTLLDGTLPANASGYDWHMYYTVGITAKVTKKANLITTTVSDWNSYTINEATKLSIDLNDYDWGHWFIGPVRYGYCSHGTPESHFSDVNFTFDNLALSTLLAQINLSKDITNGLSIKADGLYSETIKVSAQTKNALIKNTDGYYVEKTEVSFQPDNSLKKLSDGLYVRDTSNTKTVTKAAHGFIEGDFIFYHPITGYAKASALDDYNSNIVGMVSKVIDVNNFEYKWAGFHATTLFSNTNGYAQGMPLYISDIDPGKTVQNQPDISKTVGYPVEDMGIIISIERGIQYNQEAAIGDFKQSPNTYNVRSDGFIKVSEGVLYKQTLIDRLLQTLDIVFKDKYIIFNDSDQTIEFKNTEELYIANNVLDGFNLFIKAF